MSRNRHIRMAAAMAALLAQATTCAVQASGVCYVNASTPAAVGNQDGTSWAKAYATLSLALVYNPAFPSFGCGTRRELWVAKGIYKPTASTDQTQSFIIRPGDAVYGGFAGNETSRGQRNPALNLTVLSGDLNNDDSDVDSGNGVDTAVSARNSDNSYHVVAMDGTTSAGAIRSETVLDGFTITAGNAHNLQENTTYFGGGGLYCNGEAGTCSPSLSNLVFSGNNAYEGGAIYADGESGGASSPVVTRVIFSGNAADFDGGAIYSDGHGGASSPKLQDVLFNGDTTTTSLGRGGAMYDDGVQGVSSPVLVNVTFSADSTAESGGAMYSLGQDGISSPILTNVTFGGNSSGKGGAMYNDGTSGQSSPTLTNVTFSGNTAQYYGGAIYNYGGEFNGEGPGQSEPSLTNVIIWLGIAGTGGPDIYNDTATANVDHGVIQHGCPAGSVCSNIITANPLLGVLANNGGFAPTMPLGAGSSAIDTGSALLCPATDERGVARPQGAGCDIGAVEAITDRIFHDGFEGQ